MLRITQNDWSKMRTPLEIRKARTVELVGKIQEIINNNANMTFWYKTSNPTKERVVKPIEIKKIYVLCKEVDTGKIKTFIISDISFDKIKNSTEHTVMICDDNRWNCEDYICTFKANLLEIRGEKDIIIEWI